VTTIKYNDKFILQSAVKQKTKFEAFNKQNIGLKWTISKEPSTYSQVPRLMSTGRLGVEGVKEESRFGR